MKRRSQPKQRKSKGTYGKKLREGRMMYGPRPHRIYNRSKLMDNKGDYHV